MLETINLKKELQILCDEVKQIIKDRINQYGANPRAKGKNTLMGSKLETELEVNPTENGLALVIANYWYFIARGWMRTHNSQYAGTYHLLIKNLIRWATDKNITIGNMNKNQVAYYVAWKMIHDERPIPPREFLVPDLENESEKNYKLNDPIGNGRLMVMIPELEEAIDKWADNIWKQITEELDKKYFNS